MKSVKRETDLLLYIFSGKNVKQYFQNEIGGHRWQRVPPTESKGRVHTSTITVAVMDYNIYNYILNYKDIERIYTRGTGPGGQHKNKVETCVILTHKPTGISCKIDGRERRRNEEIAFKELEKRVKEHFQQIHNEKTMNERKKQVGNGLRSEKRRTYRVKDSKVIDHITKKKVNLKKILKGDLKLLH